MRKKIITLFMVFCFVQSLHNVSYSANERKYYVRIAVLRNAESAVVSARGVYSVVNPATEEIIARGKVLKRSRVKNIGGIINIGKSKYDTRRIRLESKKDKTVRIKGKDRRYRGDIDIIANKDGTITIINNVELEKYIRGVLYHEVSSKWPMNATKAQAVAVRSYVMYQMKAKKRLDYDVTSDIYSQVYGGKSAERYRTNIASKETAGEILMFDDDILPTYYHSNCAGHTEDAGSLWNHDLAPLKGVKCLYDKNAPNNYWRRNFRSKDVQDKLVKKGYDIGLIKDILVVGRNRSGRVTDVRITDRKGNSVDIPGKDFRLIVGPNHVKSSKYDVIMKGYFFDLEGKGWGHGVGMCQWGANGMAKEKIHYKDILEYYYPGSELVDYRQTGVKGL